MTEKIIHIYNIIKHNTPLTVLQKILLGARKWNGPRDGFVFILFRKKSRYFTTFNQNKCNFIIDLIRLQYLNYL